MSEHATSANPTPPAPNGKRRRRALVALALGFATIGVGVAAWWFLIGQYRVVTDNAYVGGNVIQITPQTAGTVVAVQADDTDLVDSGADLVVLDDADARIALQAAEAALGEAVRSVRGLYAGTGQSRAVVAQRQADLERARQEATRADAELKRSRDDLARKQALFDDHFISADALQSVRTATQAAEAASAAAHAAVSEARSAVVQAQEQQTGADVLVDNTSLDRHPRVAAAAAKVREAYLALARTHVRSPERGHVARRTAQVGERVSPGEVLMAVVPDEQMWVDANFKETELENVRIGQPVHLRSDLWGSDVVYDGKVVGLSPGTGGAFAVLPPQNASGNWIKIVQRLPVRIALDPKQLAAHPLRVGLSMRVEVDTHRRNGDMLARTPRTGSVHETDIYARQSQAADALIARVIGANQSVAMR
ncbi:HlyD family efflux transporter periplasmic adaptor subunit [Nitrogeniibacter mangrovi]|uniref:HlyD family efflux transporter periplasmic adaptor subunit n=1 Tax=Nitrogeniibacter mangrovi TaxID=2016596 RepID=A0A6C1B6Q6_9RHOO|nr:HlyD family secretion protein [Nitrogeniibacter mangrovi]QID17970.1 HlyD family efflux transporter periplasmic adaptor subunit [Nitrogeniibacter mangrovi]